MRNRVSKLVFYNYHFTPIVWCMLIGALVNNLDAEEKAAYEFAIRSVNKDTLLMLTKLEFGTKDVYDIYSTSRKGMR